MKTNRLYEPEDISNWVQQHTKGLQLREYQIEAWNVLWSQRKIGIKKRALVHLATGLGKTSVAAVDVLHYLKDENPKGRVLFVSHMNDISHQAKQTFLRVYPQFTTAIFRSSKSIPDVNIVYATFQSLLNNLDTIPADYFDYIIYDEAHHIEAETFGKVRDHFEPQFELGLTATPERADGLDILEYFGRPVFVKSLGDGIAEGWLSPVDYHIVLDETVKKAMSESFDIKTLKEIREIFSIRARNEVIADEVLARRHEIGLDLAKTIVFCQNMSAANEMAKLLGGEVYHSGIKPEDRAGIFERFKHGDLKVLCTVDMFNEGIDIPDARLVVFLRSTSSRTIFEQQLGRGLRRSPGKDKVTVLDFVANVERIQFARELGKHIGIQARTSNRGSYNMGVSVETADQTTNLYKYQDTSFDFEYQAIQLLDRYNELKSSEYMQTDEIVDLFKQTNSVSKVAKIMEVSTTAIYKHLKKAGIDTSGHMGKLKNVSNHDLAAQFHKLKSASAVAKIYGVNSGSILDRLRKIGVDTSMYKPTQKYTDQEIIDAYEENGRNLRATARYLGQSHGVLGARLKKIGASVKPRNPARISEEYLREVYELCKGDINQMVDIINGGKSWADVYLYLDRYGYIDSRPKPMNSAVAATAYWKFGSSVKAAEHLGVSSTLIFRLSKGAKYLPKYGKRKGKPIKQRS